MHNISKSQALAVRQIIRIYVYQLDIWTENVDLKLKHDYLFKKHKKLIEGYIIDIRTGIYCCR